jgi:hypothetical protein
MESNAVLLNRNPKSRKVAKGSVVLVGGSFRYEVTTIALDIWLCQTRNFGFSVSFCRME